MPVKPYCKRCNQHVDSIVIPAAKYIYPRQEGKVYGLIPIFQWRMCCNCAESMFGQREPIFWLFNETNVLEVDENLIEPYNTHVN